MSSSNIEFTLFYSPVNPQCLAQSLASSKCHELELFFILLLHGQKVYYIPKNAETEGVFTSPRAKLTFLKSNFKSEKMESIYLFNRYLLCTEYVHTRLSPKNLMMSKTNTDPSLRNNLTV